MRGQASDGRLGSYPKVSLFDSSLRHLPPDILSPQYTLQSLVAQGWAPHDGFPRSY